VQKYINTDLTLERYGNKGWYVFGKTKVFMEFKTGKLTSRVGGGYTFFVTFIKNHVEKFSLDKTLVPVKVAKKPTPGVIEIPEP
jgi:hypothetical protein